MKNSLRGTNYGRVCESKSAFVLENAEGGRFLSVDYSKITNVALQKQELIVETQVGEGQFQVDQVSEIRFFVQQNEGEMRDEEEDEGSYAEKCLKDLTSRTRAQQGMGQAVAVVQDVSCVVPRGKFSVSFYGKQISLHGSTYSYKVLYSNFERGFILPLGGQGEVVIVLALKSKVTLGRVPHGFLVLQVPRQKRAEVDINRKAARGELDLAERLEGEQFEILVDLIHKVAGVALIQPGTAFKSAKGLACVRASLKAQSGWLFLLKKSVIFVPRLVFYLRSGDIDKVMFLKVNRSAQFDMKFMVKGEKDVELMGVEKGQLDGLISYFKERGIGVMMDQEYKVVVGEDQQDSDEDEDFKEDEVKESSYESSGEEEIGSEEQVEESGVEKKRIRKPVKKERKEGSQKKSAKEEKKVTEQQQSASGGD